MPESAGDPKCFLAYYDLEDLAWRAYRNRSQIKLAARREAWLKLRRYIIKQKIRKIPHNAELAEVKNALQWKPTATDRGLFQISDYWYPNFSDADSLNPNKNARFAFGIFLDWGESFDAWAAYRDGLHKRYLDRAFKVADEYLGFLAEAVTPERRSANAEFTEAIKENQHYQASKRQHNYPAPANTYLGGENRDR
jgi:hypothetical protein